MKDLIFVIGFIAILFIATWIHEYISRGDKINSLQKSISTHIQEEKKLLENIDSLKKSCSRALQNKQDELEAAKAELSQVHTENRELKMDKNVLNMKLARLESCSRELQIAKVDLSRAQVKNNSLLSDNIVLRKTLHEAPLGFPSLLNALKLYDEARDEKLSTWLERKSHPAYTSAQIVREETRKRREAEYKSRNAEMLLDYYFSVFPEAQEDNEASTENVGTIEAAPSKDDEDIAARYLSREEYQSLSRAERNQLALDRFWKMPKSKRLIGKLYEQYIGYLYEREGWIVDYFGITKGFEDLGRDLLCHKNITTLIVQCKNWSKSKTIYEKHIFQLFGTTYEYSKNNPFEEVQGVFYTATALSDLARSFAKSFNIELHEDFKLKQFPIIKCNIGREGERIYHLPFDQQYYHTKLKAEDGDFYCMTVAEAEAKGFRRAYRWRGF